MTSAAQIQIVSTTFNILLAARDMGITGFAFTEDSGVQERHSVQAWLDDLHIYADHIPTVTESELARVRAGLRAERRAMGV